MVADHAKLGSGRLRQHPWENWARLPGYQLADRYGPDWRSLALVREKWERESHWMQSSRDLVSGAPSASRARSTAAAACGMQRAQGAASGWLSRGSAP